MKKKILRVKDLQLYFSSREGKIRAINGISFDLYKNEILGIIGESGCGKSVTSQAVLNILSNNARVESGQIHMTHKGTEYNILDEKQYSDTMISLRRNSLSMIFQEPMTSFSPLHTVGNQIMESLLMTDELLAEPKKKERKKLARLKATELLFQVGLTEPDILDAYPHNISGGMLQRCMIAMALSCNPKILIADEPTTALDVTLQAQILNLMLDLQEKHEMSIIFITHDLGVISEIADRVFVMYLGKCVESANVYELFKNPLHPYTKSLLKATPRLKGDINKLEPIKGIVPNPINIPQGCSFHPRCSDCYNECSQSQPHLMEVEKDHFVSCLKYSGENQ